MNGIHETSPKLVLRVFVIHFSGVFKIDVRNNSRLESNIANFANQICVKIILWAEG